MHGIRKVQLSSIIAVSPFTMYMPPAHGSRYVFAYIDRSNTEAARKGLEPAVEALKNGRSIAIAPEGTRSPTPRLLPFKKGPFHLAVQAGVPVVPIVMRNCGEIMAAHSMIIHPGTVDVAVLPPVPTDDWTKDTFDTKIAAVRQMYLDTLGDWPED